MARPTQTLGVITIIAASVALTFSIAALIVSSIGYSQDTPHLKFHGNLPAASSPATVVELITKCTNSTLGEEVTISDGSISVMSKCPLTGNMCSQSICKIDGTCEETLIDTPGATCFLDSQCSSNGTYVCSDSCQCVPAENPPCSVDSDCEAIEWTTCLEAICVSGQCIQNLTAGSECSGGSCGPGFSCSNCTCTPNPSSESWTVWENPVYSTPDFSAPFSFFVAYYLYDVSGSTFELSFYIETPTNTTAQQKTIVFDVSSLSVTLNTAVNGTAIIQSSASQYWSLNPSVCTGFGTGLATGATEITFTINCMNAISGSTFVTHYVSAQYLWPTL